MTQAFKEVERQARNLTTDERAQLAETLLESIQEPITQVEAEWKLEIESRLDAYEQGAIEAVSAEAVFADAAKLTH